VELSPQLPQAHETLAHYLVERGKSLAAEDVGAAIETLKEGEDAARESIRLLELQAVEAGRSIERQPERAWAYVNLGSALIERSRLLEAPDAKLLAEAAETYERALSVWDEPPTRIEEHEVYVSALINTCDVLTELGELERALDVCTEVTKMLPDDAVVFYNLAGVHALAGRRDEALVALRRDLELGDTDWKYLVGDRWFETLADDPAFLAIVDDMKRAASE
jgi:tetratricopeptide (TPR) repeat protein